VHDRLTAVLERQEACLSSVCEAGWETAPYGQGLGKDQMNELRERQLLDTIITLRQWLLDVGGFEEALEDLGIYHLIEKRLQEINRNLSDAARN
jgi:hypothetical protein